MITTRLLLWIMILCAGAAGGQVDVDPVDGTPVVSSCPDEDRSLAALRVEPDSLTMRRGETRQLSVRCGDQAGERAAEVTWHSQRPVVAVVDSDGRVSARGLGSTIITASTGEATGSSRVKVVDFGSAVEEDSLRRTERSGPEATGRGGPNEPEGFQPLTDRSFQQLTEDGWSASGNFEITEEMDVSGSVSTVGRIRFAPGFEGGRTPGWTTNEQLEQYEARSLYLSFRIRLSENWQSVGSGVSKIGFIWMHDNPVVFPTNWTYGSDPIEPQIRLQRTPEGARNLHPNLADVNIRRGEWTRWEILLVANTGDNRNGEAHWWIDGTKVGEYRDVIYGSAEQEKIWQIVAWRPTWGGVDDVVREDMAVWMDRLYVSGSRQPHPGSRP